MWFVPKISRGKFDQRWRYGIFLGRSLSRDQNFAGFNTGDVVFARAIVRVVPGIRWAPDRLANIQMTPMSFKPESMDRIEANSEPQTHPDPNVDTGAAARQVRRLRIMDTDVKKYGYTDSCPRCEYLKQNKLLLARGTRHNEECREHFYEAMREDGTEKLQRADLEDSARTQTRSRKPKEPSQPPANDSMDVQTNVEDAPTEPLGDGVANDETPHEHEPTIVDDTANFYEGQLCT